MNEATTATIGSIAYISQDTFSTDGSVKAGCGPRKACTIIAPETAAMTMPPSTLLPKSLLSISSRTKVMAASGVLKAAARAAAAPVAVGDLRFAFGTPRAAARFDATPPPTYTDGPSRPRLVPPP